ncbi:speract receptor-like [Dendronephthya gigantea]|uniref:speract receptor-like n=1 Tax=Dendronephthya gigantea TaxID=151771 RepID=UPI00106BCF1B|nr:speract receptor-like [Dendronephthya gigantea]XP_028392240.1 speract receptor-like [Dendronephthya gigantea]XP_028392241.1 speract receptor-like [Dendronephthya gigantea]
MASKMHIVVFPLILAFASANSLEEFKLGVLLPYTFDANWDFPAADHYASAVSLAVEKVNSDPTTLPNAKLSFIWNNTACNQSKMVAQQHWQIKQGVVGFIGPSCYGRKAARVAKRRDLAVVSYDCQDTHVSNKKLYPNFARTNPQHSKAAFPILSFLKARGLERVKIVYQGSKKWMTFKKFVARLLRRNGVEIADTVKVTMFEFAMGAVPGKFNSIPSGSQATILATDFGIAREIMYYMQAYAEKNPSDSYSKHHFITAPSGKVEIKVNIQHPFKWFFSHFVKTTKERTNVTKRAFEKLSIVANVPDMETDQHKAFEEELKKKSSEYPWFSRAYQGCLKLKGSCIFNRSTAKIPAKGAYLYDAVMQFAKALHEVRQDGKMPTGKNIVDRLKGKHFVGADGHQHQFDENADVIYHFTILRLTRDKNDELNMLPVESSDRRR